MLKSNLACPCIPHRAQRNPTPTNGVGARNPLTRSHCLRQARFVPMTPPQRLRPAPGQSSGSPDHPSSGSRPSGSAADSTFPELVRPGCKVVRLSGFKRSCRILLNAGLLKKSSRRRTCLHSNSRLIILGNQGGSSQAVKPGSMAAPTGVSELHHVSSTWNMMLARLPYTSHTKFL